MSKKDFSNLRAKANHSTVEISCYLTCYLTSRSAGSDLPRIRILRREEKEFTFDHDYAEYFDGLSSEGAEVIFEGELELINKGKIVFHDKTVENGTTYVYWVSLPDGSPTGPVAVRVRDTELWWPNDKIEHRLQALAERYPQIVRMQEFGTTIRGRFIRGLVAGNSDKLIALIGAIHPGESGPELIVPALERVLDDHPEVLEQVGVAILPSVCIDQREKMVEGNPWYLRKNFNEVDLNRNFSAEWENVEYTYDLVTSDPDAATYRGAAPCSEPETRAVMNFIEQTKPLCVFSYHCLAGICGPNFLTSKFAADNSGFKGRCEKYATPFQNGFYGNAEKEVNLQFACTSGSLNTWLYQQWNIPGFDLEWEGDEKSRISLTDNVTRELMTEYQDRHYQALLRVLQGA